MSYSNEFKINVNKLHADEMLLVLLEINHANLASPIRLVCDNKDFLFNDNQYLAMAFNFKRQNDIQGELPKSTLTIENVGRSLVKWVDASGGGRGATVKVILARRSAPTVTDESIEFGIESVTVTTQSISISLVVQNNLIKRMMKYVYDIKRSTGLF